MLLLFHPGYVALLPLLSACIATGAMQNPGLSVHAWIDYHSRTYVGFVTHTTVLLLDFLSSLPSAPPNETSGLLAFAVGRSLHEYLPPVDPDDPPLIDPSNPLDPLNIFVDTSRTAFPPLFSSLLSSLSS